MADTLPLLHRFPALERIPRAGFIASATPLEPVTLANGRTLFVKRDDLCGRSIGGNKVRALDWLLGSVGQGERVLTVGARGSTHALTTALCAGALGVTTTVVRWNQEMNETAHRVDARMRLAARVIDAHMVPCAYAVSAGYSMQRNVFGIPAGGSTPLGVLGHVNAALELANQISAGQLEAPDVVVVPLGTGGTAAGLALGFRIAGLPTRIVGARVVPRIIGRAKRIVRLANNTARVMEHVSGSRLPRVALQDIDVDDSAYGGAYGRAIAPMSEESALTPHGITLDDTYSRKAFRVAVDHSLRHRTLFWLTFDARILN